MDKIILQQTESLAESDLSRVELLSAEFEAQVSQIFY